MVQVPTETESVTDEIATSQTEIESLKRMLLERDETIDGLNTKLKKWNRQ